MTIKLFISYRSTDSVKVDTIVAQLASLKDEDGTPIYSCWQDKYGIPPGRDWWDAVVDAIIDCQIFVFNISEEAVRSDICRAELRYARERNRPIIPLILEGEYIFSDRTGRFDISYWDKIPLELRDLRAQFLFYDGTSIFSKLEAAIAEFGREPRRWRNIHRPHPVDPRTDSETVDSIILYDEACDYAGRLEFETARRIFQKLINRNDEDFAGDAYEWIELLGYYERLVSMDSRINTRHRVRPLWASYQKLFPKPFLQDIFDPKGFASRVEMKENHDANRHQTFSTPISQTSPPTSLPEKEPDLAWLYQTDEFEQALEEIFSDEDGIPSEDTDLTWLTELYSEIPPEEIQRPSFVAEVERLLSTFIMPLPFAWVDIPAGWVAIDYGGFATKNGQMFVVPEFAISKYPITNAQYAVFVESGGYLERYWWTVEGWSARESGMAWNDKRNFWQPTNIPWIEPKFWQDKKWNEADTPVVGLSWYECVAFCRWLSEVTGESITLPTEQQWQRASQGDRGLVYPWGDNWDKGRCNSQHHGSGQTTPVTKYEGKGDSPYGVVDLSGNVWEWCLTNYRSGSNELSGDTGGRILRGGAWNIPYVRDFRSAYRNRNSPYARSNTIGFRIARSYS